MVKARQASPLFGAVTKPAEATVAVEDAPPAPLATGTVTAGALGVLATGAGVLGALATGTATLEALGVLATVPVLLLAASAVLESHPHCRARVEHTTNDANIDCL
jgi:hypothetical protein